jgi:hypothetical protein
LVWGLYNLNLKKKGESYISFILFLKPGLQSKKELIFNASVILRNNCNIFSIIRKNYSQFLIPIQIIIRSICAKISSHAQKFQSIIRFFNCLVNNCYVLQSFLAELYIKENTFLFQNLKSITFYFPGIYYRLLKYTDSTG